MLGSNVSTVGGLSTGFQHADKWGCECIQIYLTLSRRWDVPNLSEGEIVQFKKARRKSSVKQIVAHLPYLANLASPDKNLHIKARDRLVIELDRAKKLAVPFLVIHPGNHMGSGELQGLQMLIKNLNSAIAITNNISTEILVETMSGQGTELGHSFEQIEKILKQLNTPKRFGVCFDTCHVFAAGYDISSYKGYEKVLSEFDKIIGLKKIKAFHLNGSKNKLGSHCDRHASIEEGYLGLECFHALVRDSRFINIPKILEIPERDKKSQYNLKLLRKLQKKIRLN